MNDMFIINRRYTVYMTLLSKPLACLETDSTLDGFVKSWEHCQLPASEWNHAAHVAVAAYYACSHSPAEAHLRMKRGVSAFNACSEGKNTENSGYHETLTRF